MSLRIQFFFIFVFAFLLHYIPILSIPFNWVETFFHEISHGLMALLSGGSIQSITLNYNGSGHCISQGGITFLISFSGYLGSVFWGAIIFLSVSSRSPNSSNLLLSLLIITLIVTAYWAVGLSTYLIIISLTLIFLFILIASSSASLKIFIQLLGAYVLLNAIRSPLNLINNNQSDDALTLSQLTYLPEIFWILCWFFLGLFSLYFIFRSIFTTYQNT